MAFSPSILTKVLPPTFAIRAPPNTLPLGSASGRFVSSGSITAPMSPFSTVTWVLPSTLPLLPPPYTLPPILICPCATIVLRSITINMVITRLIPNSTFFIPHSLWGCPSRVPTTYINKWGSPSFSTDTDCPW